MRVVEVQGNDPEKIASALFSAGVCKVQSFIDEPTANALREEARVLLNADAFTAARMGRGASITSEAALRGDQTLWLDDPRCTVGPAFLAELNALSQHLRMYLRMPIQGVEAHYAHYPPGGRYIRHRDRMQSDSARMVSWVTYLNAGWQPEHGGLLRLYDAAEHSVDIAPTFGTSVCFLRDMEHEVLPAYHPRLSIAGWMRRLD